MLSQNGSGKDEENGEEDIAPEHAQWMKAVS